LVDRRGKIPPPKGGAFRQTKQREGAHNSAPSNPSLPSFSVSPTWVV
jgi:hypothetical protein